MTTIELILSKLKQEIFQKKRKIDDFKMEEVGYFDWNKDIKGEISDLNKGFGDVDSHYQIVFPYPKIAVDYSNEEFKACIWVKTTDTDMWNTNNPQFIVSHNHKIIRSLDMNHNYFLLPQQSSKEIYLNVYTNTHKPDIFMEVWFGYHNKCVFQLFYRLKAIYESYQLCQKESPVKVIYEELFKDIFLIVKNGNDSQKNYRNCLEIIDKWLIQQDSSAHSKVIEHVIGHTHIDLSWLWTIKQTKEKVVRSFSNALYLLDIYPEMTFMSSTPLLYEFIHEQDRTMYEQIKTFINQKRWFVEGGMYVESDINLPSGESLIRQIYYGKKFFFESFNKETKILWLPDCFGFSASLPQIIRKAELDYFFTSKMDWNETNKMPNDIFFWEGIDGSKVLSYFLTTSDYSENQSIGTTYNGRLNASQVKGTWARLKNKKLSNEVLQLYGFGDGGGGPTEEMLEYSKVFRHSLPSMPKIVHSSPQNFFNHLEKNICEKKVPKWRGELYLETHRGTYTTDGLLKRMNRETESLLLVTEWINAFEHLHQRCEPAEYPRILEKVWKKVLINHFHDILPGTSIQQVHDEAVERYQDASKVCQEIIVNKLKNIGLKYVSHFSQIVKDELWIGNPTSFLRSEVLSDDEYDYLLEGIPAFSFKKVNLLLAKQAKKKRFKRRDITGSGVIRKITGSLYQIETAYYCFVLNENGEITEFYDKHLKRNLTGEKGIFNQFQLFNDIPKDYDAWNLDQESLSQQIDTENWGRIEQIVESDYKIEISYSRPISNSTIYQTITLYNHTRRIDFETIVDWQERQKCLKTNFATSLIMPKATYDIQFGNVERPSYVNTSWDDAKFEVCAHKWADLSDEACGISLLNNCKYGYSALENQLSLTLLRSPQYPAEDIDKRIQKFTYSLYPHDGTVKQSQVYTEAYTLNMPLILSQTIEENCKPIEDMLLIDLSEETIICESIKIAYQDDAYIIRCYESFGKTTSCDIRVNQQVRAVEAVNLLENATNEKLNYSPSNGTITAEFRPFEIRTFKLFL